MRNFGAFSLYFAHALCLWGLAVSFIAFSKKDLRALKSAERTLVAILFLNLISVIVLISAFIRDDFTIKYVFEYSRRAQPLIYKITAIWGGMDGSLLLWEFILSFYCVAAIYFSRRKIYNLLPFSTFIFFVVQGFFLFLLSFKTNPFSSLRDPDGNIVNPSVLPLIDGNGLNPLLQNFYMAIHPPLLYLGFVGFAIPFAYILSVLWEKEKNPLYMIPLRYWILFSWLALGMGILFGSYWAYLELGWGGYWAWDPVENASFIPWLTATALLHTLFMERKRAIFKTTNYILIVATFLLSIFGTYLTRSGILQSVHSFGGEEKSVPFFLQLGNIFIAFMASILFLSVMFAIIRSEVLVSKKKIESSFSKESMILYGTLLFVIFAFVVFYGVTSPIFYKLFKGREIYNGGDFYNSKTVPIALFLLLVMSISILAPWGKGKTKEIANNFVAPLIFAIISVLAGFLYLYFKDQWFTEIIKEKKILFYFIFLFFVSGLFFSAIIMEYFKAAKRSRNTINNPIISLIMPIKENPKKYGAHLIHLGIVVFCIGVAFSSIFQNSYNETLNEGESFKADEVVLTFAKLSNDDFNQDINKINELKIWAEVDLFKNLKYLGTLKPMRIHYKNTLERDQPPSYEVAIKSSLFKDYYLILGGFDLIKKQASLTLFVNPFVSFLWLGGFMVLIGGIVAIVPSKRLR